MQLEFLILGTSLNIVIIQFLGSTMFSNITLGTMSRQLYGIHFPYLWLTYFTIILGTYFMIVITQLLNSAMLSNIMLGKKIRHFYWIHFRYLWLTSFTFPSITNLLKSISFFEVHFRYLWLSYCLYRGWILYMVILNYRRLSILFVCMYYFLSMYCLLLFIVFIKRHGTRGLSTIIQSFTLSKKDVLPLFIMSMYWQVELDIYGCGREESK